MAQVVVVVVVVVVLSRSLKALLVTLRIIRLKTTIEGIIGTRKELIYWAKYFNDNYVKAES